MALEQFSDVVQRCQAVQDDSYTTKDYDVFTLAGRACIQEGNSVQVLSIVVDDNNKDIVRCMGWTLLPPLVQVLRGKEKESHPQCEAVLNHLLKVCSPKELLVGLLEQLEDTPDDAIGDTFLLLQNPLTEVLRRLGGRKASSLGMVLSTMLEQVAKLPVPQTAEQEGDTAFPLCLCCTVLMTVAKSFVDEARLHVKNRTQTEAADGGHKWAPGGEELRVELLKFCMKSLCEPLLDIQLRDSDTLDPAPLRDFSINILQSLTAIGESLSSLVCLPVLKRKKLSGFLEEETRYPQEALASLAHLLFVHHISIDAFPTVFCPVFILRCNMEHVSLLLSRMEETRVRKGLELYEKSLVMLEDDAVSVNELEIKTFTSVPQSLVKVMTLCPEQRLRTKGLQVFQLSINKFTTEAKYKFFQCMLNISNHSGVEGYIIKNIRTQIDFSLKPGNANEWFQGPHLLPLLRKAFWLPEGPETDLLQYLDRIMEALNLLRYLVIRDKVTENQTGIWTDLDNIECQFLKPLRTGLSMSRAHYEMELKNTIQSKRGQAKEDSVLSVTVGIENLPNMSSDSQIQALHSALHTFDMMESVLVRVAEITETKDNKETSSS